MVSLDWGGVGSSLGYGMKREQTDRNALHYEASKRKDKRLPTTYLPTTSNFSITRMDIGDLGAGKEKGREGGDSSTTVLNVFYVI